MRSNIVTSIDKTKPTGKIGENQWQTQTLSNAQILHAKRHEKNSYSYSMILVGKYMYTPNRPSSLIPADTYT